jgi:hypothetical protein
MSDALTTVRHMFRLDEDLSGFYSVVREDGELAWCAHRRDACCRPQPSLRTSSRRREPSYESSAPSALSATQRRAEALSDFLPQIGCFEEGSGRRAGGSHGLPVAHGRPFHAELHRYGDRRALAELAEPLVHLRGSRANASTSVRVTPPGVSSLSGVLSAWPVSISAAAPREARSPLAASSFNVVPIRRFFAAADQWASRVPGARIGW